MFPGRSKLLFLMCLALAGASRAEAPPGPKPRLDLYGDPLPPGAVARLGTVRLRPGNGSPGLVFLASGKTLLSGNYDGVVRFWDAATGKSLQPLPVSEGRLQAIALSPDGKALAVAGYQGVSLWNGETRELIRKLKAGSIRSLAFTPDGKTLVSGGSDRDRAIRVWDLTTGKERRRMMWHNGAVTNLIVAPDGRTLISVSSAGRKVHFADLNTGEEIRTITERNWSDLDAVLLTPDGKSLVLGGGRVRKVDRVENAVHIEGFLDIYDPATGKRTRALEGHDRHITGAVLAPDGNTLISSDYGGTVRVWDLAAGKELRKWNAQGTIRLISPDGKTVAGTGRGGVIHLWNLATGKLLHEHEGHQGSVGSLAFGPDGKTLASSSFYESAARLWDLTNGRQLRVLSGHEGDRGYVPYVRAVCFLPDGSGVISGASDSTLRFWDPATGKEVRRFQLQGRRQVLSMGLSADGQRLLCTSTDFDDGPQTLTVFDVASGKKLVHREEKGDFSTFPAFSPDGKTFAQSRGKEVVLREVDTGKEVIRLQGPDLLEEPFVFSPDGKWLAMRSSIQKLDGRRFVREDCKVRLFEVATGKEKLALAAEGWHRSLAFSPRGELLAGADNKTIRIWDLAAGKERWTSPALDYPVNSLAFAPDGKTLASGLSNGTILLWDVTQSPAK